MTPQSEIFSALSTDSAILTIVSNDTTRISNHFPSVELLKNPGDNFPKITFVETSRQHLFFTDNVPRMDRIVYGVYIWISESALVNYQLSTIGIEVDRVMLSLGYRKSDSNDETLTTEKVHARVLEYVKEISSNR